ncbi:major facilitator superfamily protein [Klebsiella pneumoniae]|uniref:Major facilitator superfamily protein n=1 Tax=Klebsiella pneumoniae TaxID=573 RepID=A0A447RGD5_KLEPN|nr:major facilitator superfamily protein [Klebsiella pneumoniae]
MLMVMNFFPGDRFLRLWQLAAGAAPPVRAPSITHSLLYAFFITLAYPLGCLFCTRASCIALKNKWQIVLSAR